MRALPLDRAVKIAFGEHLIASDQRSYRRLCYEHLNVTFDVVFARTVEVYSFVANWSLKNLTKTLRLFLADDGHGFYSWLSTKTLRHAPPREFGKF